MCTSYAVATESQTFSVLSNGEGDRCVCARLHHFLCMCQKQGVGDKSCCMRGSRSRYPGDNQRGGCGHCPCVAACRNRQQERGTGACATLKATGACAGEIPILFFSSSGWTLPCETRPKKGLALMSLFPLHVRETRWLFHVARTR